MNIKNLFSLIFIGCLFATNTDCAEKVDPVSELAILTLNLHSYQEISTSNKKEIELNSDDALQRVADYDPIFNTIVKGIDELEPAIICLQEVGEWKESTVKTDSSKFNPHSFGIDPTNAVRQLLSRIKSAKYYHFMDWSHFGWNVWKEGTAILSKYPILEKESRYISDINNGTYKFWQSRKVTRVKVKTSDSKFINIFSVHSGWWDSEEEPFQSQFNRLMEWVDEIELEGEETILCGDFNQPAAEKGYQLITTSNQYIDLYLQANPNGMYHQTIGGEIDGWKGTKQGKRVDYLFMKKKSSVRVIKSQRVFTERIFGRVSDHLGIFAQLEFIARTE